MEKRGLIVMDDFIVFSANLVHIMGKWGWRVEVYTQKCLKCFSETTIKLALFLSLLLLRLFLKKIFLKKHKDCMPILYVACSNEYEKAGKSNKVSGFGKTLKFRN